MTVFVACDHDFKLQPEVGDACTGLLKELYGEERGVPARSSIGQAALPYGFPVEIEVMVNTSKFSVILKIKQKANQIMTCFLFFVTF